jgi:hypothetical protein
MRKQSVIALAIGAVLSCSCAKRVPEQAGVARGTPHVSWIIMSGDRDNADQDFVCQSEPRTDCVVPVSRPGADVFSDVHVYYHGAGAETKYAGSVEIGFFRGDAAAHRFQTNMTVQKTGSIANQAVTGIVTSTPGTYAISFQLVSTVTGAGKAQPLRQEIPVTVK